MATASLGLSLRLLAVGKLRDPGLEGMIADYQKRLRPWLTLDIVECKSGDQLRSKCRPRPLLLDERGKTMSSETFAAWLGRQSDHGQRSFDLCIGDAHGFNDEDRAQAGTVLSLSAMTLPHRIARLVLVEQLYRAASILAGHPYHHA